MAYIIKTNDGYVGNLQRNDLIVKNSFNANIYESQSYAKRIADQLKENKIADYAVVIEISRLKEVYFSFKADLVKWINEKLWTVGIDPICREHHIVFITSR